MATFIERALFAVEGLVVFVSKSSVILSKGIRYFFARSTIAYYRYSGRFGSLNSNSNLSLSLIALNSFISRNIEFFNEAYENPHKDIENKSARLPSNVLPDSYEISPLKHTDPPSDFDISDSDISLSGKAYIDIYSITPHIVLEYKLPDVDFPHNKITHEYELVDFHKDSINDGTDASDNYNVHAKRKMNHNPSDNQKNDTSNGDEKTGESETTQSDGNTEVKHATETNEEMRKTYTDSSLNIDNINGEFTNTNNLESQTEPAFSEKIIDIGTSVIPSNYGISDIFNLHRVAQFFKSIENSLKNIKFLQNPPQHTNDTISQIKQSKELATMPIRLAEELKHAAMLKNGNWYELLLNAKNELSNAARIDNAQIIESVANLGVNLAILPQNINDGFYIVESKLIIDGTLCTNFRNEASQKLDVIFLLNHQYEGIIAYVSKVSSLLESLQVDIFRGDYVYEEIILNVNPNLYWNYEFSANTEDRNLESSENLVFDDSYTNYLYGIIPQIKHSKELATIPIIRLAEELKHAAMLKNGNWYEELKHAAMLNNTHSYNITSETKIIIQKTSDDKKNLDDSTLDKKKDPEHIENANNQFMKAVLSTGGAVGSFALGLAGWGVYKFFVKKQPTSKIAPVSAVSETLKAAVASAVKATHSAATKAYDYGLGVLKNLFQGTGGAAAVEKAAEAAEAAEAGGCMAVAGIIYTPIDVDYEAIQEDAAAQEGLDQKPTTQVVNTETSIPIFTKSKKTVDMEGLQQIIEEMIEKDKLLDEYRMYLSKCLEYSDADNSEKFKEYRKKVLTLQSQHPDLGDEFIEIMDEIAPEIIEDTLDMEGLQQKIEAIIERNKLLDEYRMYLNKCLKYSDADNSSKIKKYQKKVLTLQSQHPDLGDEFIEIMDEMVPPEEVQDNSDKATSSNSDDTSTKNKNDESVDNKPTVEGSRLPPTPQRRTVDEKEYDASQPFTQRPTHDDFDIPDELPEAVTPERAYIICTLPGAPIKRDRDDSSQGSETENSDFDNDSYISSEDTISCSGRLNFDDLE